ncbi:MAG TPA: hypothetical protein VGE74_19615, partial [Gemmata sp.]
SERWSNPIGSSPPRNSNNGCATTSAAVVSHHYRSLSNEPALTAYDPELAHEIENCDPFADDAEGGPLPPGGAGEVFARLEAEVNPMLNELRRAFDA